MGKAYRHDNDGVIRGGFWFSPPAFVRVVERGGSWRGYRNGNLGVRLVRRRSALERLVEEPQQEEASDGQER